MKLSFPLYREETEAQKGQIILPKVIVLVNGRARIQNPNDPGFSYITFFI